MAAFAQRRNIRNRVFVERQAAAESATQFRDLFDNSGLGIQIVNLDGRRLMVNKAMSDLLGYDSVADLMAIPPQGILAPHERDRGHSMTKLINAAGDIPSTFEIDAVRKDGSVIPLQVFWRKLEWEGEPAIQRTYVDLSERKRAETALAQRERQYRELIEESPLGIQIVDREGNRLLVNSALATMLGYETVAEIMALPFRGLLAPDHLSSDLTLENFEDPNADIPSSREINLQRKDGSILAVQIFRRVLVWEGKNALLRIYIDISERKRAEAALLDNERRYRDLIEQNPLGIQIVDGHINRLLVNKALVDMLGYESAEEIKRLPFRGFISPDDPVRFLPLEDLENAATAGPSTSEVNLVRKDGSILPAQIFRRILVWEGKKAVQRTYIDISERKRAQQALVDSERQYRDLIEQALLGIQIADGDGNRLLVNDALVTLLGYESADEIIALPARGFIAPYHHGRAMTFAEMVNSEDQNAKYREIDLVHKDGSIVPVQIFGRSVNWEDKRAIQLTYVDLSERRRAEKALVDSESRYRDLIEGSTLGIHIADHNEDRLFVNLSLAKLLGYDTLAEFVRLKKFAMLAPHSRHRVFGLTDMESLEEGQIKSYEIDLLRKDGSLVPVEVYPRVIEWNGERAIQRFIVDISERKQHERGLRERDRTVQELREALARASRISTMAEISSVIAHELHQPLTAIANTASAAQRRLGDETVDKSAVLDEMLPLIAQQADRAGRVIGGIRKLFEGGTTERSVEKLDLIIDEACHLVTNESRSEIVDFTRQFETPPICALVDRVQIQQVMYNLLRNAIDAVQDVPDKSIAVSITIADDGSAQISVQDNGTGLSPEVTATLFDPFVTTKEKGMGMGLYTCQHIVESHGGRIWTESVGGSGTTVSFTLPLAGQA
jgi:two-component system sensor kinase FixL